MTLEELDALRGNSITVIILSMVAIGVASHFESRYARVARIILGCLGGAAGLTLFFLFNFVSGWDE
jgi:hypothetical protein